MDCHPFKLLLHGIDTLQCAYFLHAPDRQGIDFQILAEQKVEIRQSKSKKPIPITLGNSDFLLLSKIHLLSTDEVSIIYNLFRPLTVNCSQLCF